MDLAFYKKLAAFKGGFSTYFSAEEQTVILDSSDFIEALAPHFSAADIDDLLSRIPSPVTPIEAYTGNQSIQSTRITTSLLRHAANSGEAAILEKISKRKIFFRYLRNNTAVIEDAFETAIKHNHIVFAQTLNACRDNTVELESHFLSYHSNPSLETVRYLHETRDLPLEIAFQYTENPEAAAHIKSLLTTAATHDNLDVVRYCIDRGCDPHRVIDSKSLFERACASGSLKVVQYLVESNLFTGRETLLGGAVTSLLETQGNVFQYLAERPEIAAVLKQASSPALKEALARNNHTLESLRTHLFEDGRCYNLNILPPLKNTGLYEALVPENIRRDEAALPDYDLWRKHGKGEAAWIRATGEPAPCYLLSSLSPYGFRKKVYAELAAIFAFAAHAEGNNYMEYAQEATILTVLFGSTEAAERYLSNHAKANPDSLQPIHDACLFNLPSKGDWTVPVWRDLVLKHGFKATKYLSQAPQYERELGRPPNNLQELQALKNVPMYENRDANLPFARLCHAQGISEAGFNRGMQALVKAKNTDNIPDIGIIDGKYLDNKAIDHGGYYMMKLAPDDARALVIGKMVDCCNHVDGETKLMAEKTITSPDCGVYAVFKKSSKTAAPNPQTDAIVGKTTVWMAESGNVVFNSWERKGGYAMHGEDFLDAAAEKILRENPAIDRVVLGRNRDAFDRFTYLGQDSTDYASLCKTKGIEPPALEKPRDAGSSSPDSLEQYLVLDQTGLSQRIPTGASLTGSGLPKNIRNSLARSAGTFAERTAMPAPTKAIHLS